MPKNRKRKTLEIMGGTELSVASTKQSGESAMLVSTQGLRRRELD